MSCVTSYSNGPRTEKKNGEGYSWAVHLNPCPAEQLGLVGMFFREVKICLAILCPGRDLRKALHQLSEAHFRAPTRSHRHSFAAFRFKSELLAGNLNCAARIDSPKVRQGHKELLL